MVATPPDSHLELTLSALEQGKHVIVEKPAFLRSADFAAVRAAEHGRGRRVLVAENYCYKPLARVLQQMSRSGVSRRGALRPSRRGQATAAVHGWRDDQAIAGGGALFEGGVHWIDLLANLGLRWNRCTGSAPATRKGPERSMLVVARYREGARGHALPLVGRAVAARGLTALADLRHPRLGRCSSRTDCSC